MVEPNQIRLHRLEISTITGQFLKYFFQMSDYSSDAQPPRSSGWDSQDVCHRLGVLGGGAGRWDMTPSTPAWQLCGWFPTQPTSPTFCSPPKIPYKLSTFQLSSDPFPMPPQLPFLSQDADLVLKGSLNFLTPARDSVLQVRLETTVLFTCAEKKKKIQEGVMVQKQAVQTNSTMNVFHFDHPFQPITELRQYFVLQKLVPSRPAVDLLFLLELALPF